MKRRTGGPIPLRDAATHLRVNEPGSAEEHFIDALQKFCYITSQKSPTITSLAPLTTGFCSSASGSDNVNLPFPSEPQIFSVPVELGSRQRSTLALPKINYGRGAGRALSAPKQCASESNDGEFARLWLRMNS